jgi:hypothetical protein
MSTQIYSPDKNSNKRIYNLLVLKGESLIKAHFSELRKGAVPEQEYSNFYSAMSDQVDSILTYFVNEEISASLPNRGPLADILDHAIKENYEEQHFKRLELAKADLPDLFSNKTDFIIGSAFLDFKVGTYSVFEKYVGKLYDKIAPKNRQERKEKELIKFIGLYSSCTDEAKKETILKKIKNINFYLSGAEKIEYVLSKCGDADLDIVETRDFLNFYRKQRNTVHNLGMNEGGAHSTTIEGIEIRLGEHSASYTSDRNALIYASKKLLRIYEKIESCIERKLNEEASAAKPIV